MSLPDKCPNCGAIPRSDPFPHRRIYACGSWINDGREGLANKSDTCDDWRTIRDAGAVIRAFLDANPNAREMGQNWIAENIP